MNIHRLVGALVLGLSSSAFAVPVTFQVTGTLANSGIAGYSDGATFTGQVTYDTSALPVSLFPLGQGTELATYDITQPNAFTLDVGDKQHLSSSDLSVAVMNNGTNTSASEAISFTANNVVFNGQASTGYVLFTLQTTGTQHVFGSNLPADLNQSDFQPIVGTVFTTSDSSAQTVDLNVNTFAKGSGVVSSVPEASTSASMLLGLFAVASVCGLRRRPSH
jgi:hypothetical protein